MLATVPLARPVSPPPFYSNDDRARGPEGACRTVVFMNEKRTCANRGLEQFDLVERHKAFSKRTGTHAKRCTATGPSATRSRPRRFGVRFRLGGYRMIVRDNDVGRLSPDFGEGSDRWPGTSEPVAIIGVGTMGHGMATSALRAGIPTIVWGPHTWPATQKSRRARPRKSRGSAGGRGSASRESSSRWCPTPTPSSRTCARRGAWLAAPGQPGSIWVADEHDRRWRESSTSAALVEQGRARTSHLSTAPVSGSKEPGRAR